MTREEAIRRIKAWNLDSYDMEVLAVIIPELAESEDERVINELQAFLASYGADYFGTGRWQKFEDWLEKQKEQNSEPFSCSHENGDSEKPNNQWSKEDERIRKEIIYYILYKANGVSEEQEHAWISYLEKQKEQKPVETSNIDLDTKINDWVGYMLNDNAQSYSRKNVQILLDNCARFFYDYAVMCLDKPTELANLHPF